VEKTVEITPTASRLAPMRRALILKRWIFLSPYLVDTYLITQELVELAPSRGRPFIISRRHERAGEFCTIVQQEIDAKACF
jgi:hypothetical protein